MGVGSERVEVSAAVASSICLCVDAPEPRADREPSCSCNQRSLLGLLNEEALWLGLFCASVARSSSLQ